MEKFVIKPILFNGEMVCAMLDNRKSVTRRPVNLEHLRGIENPSAVKIKRACDPPYQPGDILYVQEAWKGLCSWVNGVACPRYGYAVKFKDGEEIEFYFDNADRAKKWRKYLDKPKWHWQSPCFEKLCVGDSF